MVHLNLQFSCDPSVSIHTKEMLLAEIPKDIFIDIRSSWLSWSAIVNLDIAVTNHQSRIQYYQQIKDVQNNLDTANPKYFQWISDRGMCLNKLILTGKMIKSPSTWLNLLAGVKEMFIRRDISYDEASESGLFSFINFFNSLNSLEFLVSPEMTKILEGLVSVLPHLTSIKVMEVINHPEELGPELTFVSQHCSNLEKIETMIRSDRCDPVVWSKIFQTNPKLKSVAVPDTLLDTVALHCHAIESVHLYGSKHEYDVYSMTTVINKSKLRHFSNPGGKIMIEYEKKENKKFLIVRGSKYVVDEMTHLLTTTKDLTKLTFTAFCPDNSFDMFLKTIWKQSGSTLQYLLLDDGFTAPLLKEVLLHCPVLKCFKFGPSYQVDPEVTTAAMLDMLIHTPNNIQKLIYTSNIDFTNIVKLLKGLPHLRYLVVTHIKSITGEKKFQNDVRSLVAASGGRELYCEFHFTDNENVLVYRDFDFEVVDLHREEEEDVPFNVEDSVEAPPPRDDSDDQIDDEEEEYDEEQEDEEGEEEEEGNGEEGSEVEGSEGEEQDEEEDEEE